MERRRARERGDAMNPESLRVRDTFVAPVKLPADQ
jgi:hypothetical protein